MIDAKNGGFTNWRLEYGDGNDPDNWTVLAEGNNSFGQPGVIYTWDLEGCYLQSGHSPPVSEERG